MPRFKVPHEHTFAVLEHYDGVPIFGRAESFGVYRTAVPGWGGGEHACSGPNAKRRAIEQARLRIDDMNREND